MSVSYSEKLLDPRWREKRLEILSRDCNMCCVCNSSNRLEVHHSYYIAKREPWHYPSETLFTLCNGCHKNITEYCAENFLHWETAAGAVVSSWRGVTAGENFKK